MTGVWRRTWCPARRRALAACAALPLLGGIAPQGAPPASMEPKPSVDFTRDLAPFIARCCVSCHRPGGPGAYDFTTEGGVRRAARTARAVLEARSMPPWSPVAGVVERPPIPTDAEIAAFAAWVEEGAPVADPGRAIRATTRDPDPPIVLRKRIATDWVIEEGARRTMRSFQLPVDDAKSEAVLVGGWRARWSAPGLVSLVLLASGDRSLAQSLDERDASVGFRMTGDLGATPAGALAGFGSEGSFLLPAGFAFALRGGDALVAECHADGRGRTERGDFELEALAPRPIDARPLRLVEPLPVGTAGTARLVRDGARTLASMPPFARAIDLVAIVLRPGPDAVHVVLRASRPAGGEPIVLIDVPRYDVHVDRPYRIDPPLRLAEGTRIELDVVAENEILASRATPQAVLLVSPVEAGPSDEAGVAKAQDERVRDPAGGSPSAMGVATKAWLARSERIEATGSTLLASRPVTEEVFRELVGRAPEPRTGPTDEAGCSWFEAVEAANALSRAEGLAPRYAIDFAERDDGRLVGAVVREIEGSGWRLPTATEWRAASMRDGAAAAALWNWTSDTGLDAERDWRVVCGGCWADRVEARGPDVRSAVPPATRSELFGVRFVRSAPAAKPR